MSSSKLLVTRIALIGLGIIGIIVIIWASRDSAPQSAIPVTPPAARSPSRATNTPFQPVSTPTEKGNDEKGTLTITPTESSLIPTNTTTPTLEPMLWVASYIPEKLSEALVLPLGYGMTDSPQDALVRFQIGDSEPKVTWVYALVAPFYTIPDGISSKNLIRAWRGDVGSGISNLPILVDEHTLGTFAELWGEPSSVSVKVVPEAELANLAWGQSNKLAIIPFEDIEPHWKVLEVDDRSPLRKDFDPSQYALTVSFSLEGDPELVEELLLLSESEENGLVFTNWEASKMTTLVMTGVTAMVRCTANTMERKGLTYPAEDIGPWLREADLTHISNEIPFLQECPFPNCTQADLRFCSDPSYIALLEDIGTDIVELTGDHFADYGPDAMRHTLQLYRDQNWIYYGGGENRDDARKAQILEHNGNKIAFIGCNAKGGGYATASDINPGAIECDYKWMHEEIARLREAGYMVIATFQHIEYYSYAPQPVQIEDYSGMADAGAVIVSGSQAHQPQGFEIRDDSFIHYGLGNLFFDQFNQPVCPNLACNDAFIDRHVFYDGRHIGTELLTITFLDFAKPRPMTDEERAQLLTKVFEVSVR